MNNIHNHTASPPSSIQNATLISANILEDALQGSFGIHSIELFPEGPKRLELEVNHFMTTQEALMPQQVWPPDFKLPPQIGSLSENQSDQSAADLKALLLSWGMLQLYDWFTGK